MNHISATQINMFLKCQAQYEFRYIEGLKSPPGAALTLGSCFHGATGKNYEQKIESHEDMKINDVCDIFSTHFDHARHDTAWGEDEEPGDVKDSGILTLKEYQSVIAPEVQPIQVEMKFNIVFSNLETDFLGYIDLVDDTEQIRENKTTSRKPSAISHDHKLQQTAYHTGYQVKYKRPPKASRIDYSVVKKKPEIVSIPLEIQAQDIDYFLRLVPGVLASIETGIFIPNRGHFLCSQKWCGYAGMCMKRHGGIVE